MRVRAGLTAPVVEVWRVLDDFAQLAACLPGAELTGSLPGGRYRGRASVALGPVKLAFDGSARLLERDPERHRLRVLARGSDTGGSATIADIRLSAEPSDGGTEHRTEHGTGPRTEHGTGPRTEHGTGPRTEHGAGPRTERDTGHRTEREAEHGAGHGTGHGTVLRAEVDLYLSGRIAQFGRALAGDVSRRMFERFAAEVDRKAGGQPVTPPRRSLHEWLMDLLRRRR